MNAMKQRPLYVAAVLLFFLVLMGCECQHEWEEANCTKPKTCEEIARNPDTYLGKPAKLQGEVIQSMPEGDSYTLRVNITPGQYYWSDTILVTYTKQEAGESNILEDDIVTMYGTLMGTYTYESVMGASITVPLLVAKYIDIQ